MLRYRIWVLYCFSRMLNTYSPSPGWIGKAFNVPSPDFPLSAADFDQQSDYTSYSAHKYVWCYRCCGRHRSLKATCLLWNVMTTATIRQNGEQKRKRRHIKAQTLQTLHCTPVLTRYSSTSWCVPISNGLYQGNLSCYISCYMELSCISILCFVFPTQVIRDTYCPIIIPFYSFTFNVELIIQ